ncbi:MAG: hypothetical protein V4560_09030 [Bacteroidota bacterium]|jgi:hypothetical protein
MIEDELEVKVQRVVKDPKLSLKRFSQYTVATENGKTRILKGCKYPSDYVPRYYELARKLVCDIFSANNGEHELYFETFKQQAVVFRHEAKAFPPKRDGYKNRIYSANGLDAIDAMSIHLSPILSRYTLNSNLTHRKDSITKNGVRIGAMADMLLYKDSGGTKVGFVKFNFTAKKLKEDEAKAALFVLKTFFEKQGVKLDLKSCFLVDVFAWRIYTAYNQPVTEKIVDKATIEIRDTWDLI